MGHFINIKHTHLVDFVLITWKNKHTTILKSAPKQCLSLENECNQHMVKVEPSLLSGPSLGVKKAERLFTDILNLL